MRRILILLMILFATIAYAQNQNTNQLDNKDEKAEKIPDGYGNLTWGTYLSDAKGKIAGILSYTDDKNVIISRDNELEYYYGFFYKEPSPEAEANQNTNQPAETENASGSAQEKDEGRLFYVSLNFPYLDKEQVYEKISKKYGHHTSENIKDNQGAIAWDSENTIIIMWVDSYERRPFSRKIIYISKKISKELNDYNTTIFNKTEIDLIKKLNP